MGRVGQGRRVMPMPGPGSAGGHIGLAGSFTIAEAADGSVTVLLDNSADGQTSEDAERVAQVAANFEAPRGNRSRLRRQET